MTQGKRSPTKYCAVDIRFAQINRKKVTVKTRRYKQDAKDKAFRRGAYLNVRDPRKTQSDKVLRRIFTFRSINQKGKAKSSPFSKESFSLVPYSRRKDGSRVAFSELFHAIGAEEISAVACPLRVLAHKRRAGGIYLPIAGGRAVIPLRINVQFVGDLVSLQRKGKKQSVFGRHAAVLHRRPQKRGRRVLRNPIFERKLLFELRLRLLRVSVEQIFIGIRMADRRVPPPWDGSRDPFPSSASRTAIRRRDRRSDARPRKSPRRRSRPD